MASTTNNGMTTGGSGPLDRSLPPPPPDYISGLDLGCLGDYAALATLQRTMCPDARRRLRPHFRVVGLRRWPLLTGYPDVLRDVVSLFDRPPLSDTPLVVDCTGLGTPVVQFVREAKPKAKLVPVSITPSAEGVTPGKLGGWNLGKRVLVGALQVVLQTRRLDVAELKLRDVLKHELGAFRVKVTTAGNETYEAERRADHDDLVVAVAIACWYGQRPAPGRPAVHGVQVVEFREPPRSDDGPFGGNLW